MATPEKTGPNLRNESIYVEITPRARKDSTDDEGTSVPPPPLGGVPPPPPMMGLALASEIPPGMKKRQEVKPGVKMRPLHWSKVPNNKIQDSVWSSADDLIRSIDTHRLKEVYGVVTAPRNTTTQAANTSGKLLMEPDKARIVGIFLSSGRMDAKEIASRLTSEDGTQSLPVESLTALQRIQPTPEERLLYEKYSGPVKQLQDVDRFLMELCKVEHLSSLVDVQLLLVEFPFQIQTLKPILETVNVACKEVFKPAFKRLLEYVLAIGNFLNCGSAKGNCYGFRISSLVQTYSIRGTVKGYNLLSYIVETVLPYEKSLQRLVQDMPAVRECVGLSANQLAPEVDVLEKGLEHIKKTAASLLESSGSSSQIQKFHDKVLKTVERHKSELQQLKAIRDEMLSSYNKMTIYLGEQPTTDSGEIFAHLNQFLLEFESAIEKAKTKEKVTEAREAKAAAATPVVSATSSSSVKYSAPSAASAKVTKKRTREGWLEKSSAGPIMKFDRRWFELTANGNLYYYKKEGGKALGNIYLRGVRPYSDSGNPRMFLFEVEGRKWQIIAKTPEEAKEWMDDIVQYA